MTNNEIFMLEVFLAQVIAVILGIVSIGAAEWLDHAGRISGRFYSVWVSCSITAVWLPVLGWTATVFFGFGTPSLVFVCLIAGIIFLGVYHNLPKPRSFGAKTGARSASAAFIERAKPPASKTPQLIPGSVG